MTRGFRFRLPAHAFLAAAVAVALLAGCAAAVVGTAVVGTALVATDRRTSGAQLDDETIARKAGGRLDQAFPDGRVSVAVTSYNRRVLLTGEVPSEADKATVEQVVAGIDNVVSVVNELNVGPAATFMERSRDTLLTSEVKASIVDAKDLISNSITVVTHRRVVYLMGRVTEREANRAAEVARGVSGVAKVVKVFEVISEAELANTQPKAPAKPASSANAASSP
jgi:osmotically-inducible protein OsmY